MEYGALMDTLTLLPCVNYSQAQLTLIADSIAGTYTPHEPPVAPLTIASWTRPTGT